MATGCDDPALGPRLRLNASDRRCQILGAAMELFAEHGFHGARTRDLAKRAGVSEALLFRHFPTKDALIEAILDLAGAEQRVRLLEERLEQVAPRDALLEIADHVLTRLRDRPDLFRVVFFGLLETPHLACEFHRKFLSRLLGLETRLFARAFAEQPGAFTAESVSPSVVARSFHGSLLFYNLAGAIVRIEPLPADPRSLAEAIVNLYLPGVRS